MSDKHLTVSWVAGEVERIARERGWLENYWSIEISEACDCGCGARKVTLRLRYNDAGDAFQSTVTIEGPALRARQRIVETMTALQAETEREAGRVRDFFEMPLAGTVH